MKINKKNITAFLAIFLLMLYSFTCGGLHSYIFSNSLITGITFIMILSCAYYSTSYRLKRTVPVIEVCALFCCLVIIANRNTNFENGQFENDVALITGFLFFILSVTSNKWHNYFYSIVFIWGVIHASFTLAEYFIPGFYEVAILPLFEDTTYYSDLVWVFSNNKMPGLAGHFSTNGMYLSVALVVVSIIFFVKKKSKSKNFIVLIMVAGALLFTGKRAVLIFSCFGIFIAYYMYNSEKTMKRLVKITGVTLVVLAFFSVLSVYIPGLSNFIVRFQETSQRGDITSGRTPLYALAVIRFFANPIIGTGWDSFKYYYVSSVGVFLNIHNVYLQLLSENGIIGAIPFFAFFIMVYFRSLSTAVSARKDKVKHDFTEKLALMTSIAMQTLFLLYCLTGNPLYDPQMLFPYLCATSIGEYYIRQRNLNTYGGKQGMKMLNFGMNKRSNYKYEK